MIVAGVFLIRAIGAWLFKITDVIAELKKLNHQIRIMNANNE